MVKLRGIMGMCSVCMLACCLGGCGSKIQAEGLKESTLIIRRDKSLTEVSVEAFGEAYYELSELEAYVAEEVDAYNASKGRDSENEAEPAIVVDQVAADDGEAKVILTYESAQDYSTFNHGRLDCVDAKALSAEAKSLDFVDVKTKEVLKISELEKLDELKAVVVYGPMNVAVEGKLAYVGGEASLSDERTVACEGNLSVILYR